MSDFLTVMAESSARRARSAKEAASASGLDSRVASARPSTPVDFSGRGFDLIAEAKLASPSEGPLTEGGRSRVVELAKVYADCGAAMISILTEPSRFAGSLEHLEAAAFAVDLPVMRKDFLVDPVQILEARAAGASAVLLIARILPGHLLEEMTDLAVTLGMSPLVEVFDRSDLETASSVFDRDVLVGVNCRDLETLDIDRSRFEELAPDLPSHLPTVAESGILDREDIVTVSALGYRLALVGSSLVSATDPGSLLERFLEAGRTAIRESA